MVKIKVFNLILFFLLFFSVKSVFASPAIKSSDLSESDSYIASLFLYKSGNYSNLLARLNKDIEFTNNYLPYIEYLKAQTYIKLNKPDNKNLSLGLEMLKNIYSDETYSKRFREKVLLSTGMVLYEFKRFNESINTLSGLLKSENFADNALYLTILGYFSKEEYKDVIIYADKFLEKFRDSLHFEDVFLLKGRAFSNMNMFNEAILVYDLAKNEFKSSNDLITTHLTDKKYIDSIINLLLVFNYPSFQYSKDFTGFFSNRLKVKRNEEKRILLKILEEKRVEYELNRLLNAQKLISEVNNVKIAFEQYLNRHSYTSRVVSDAIIALSKKIKKLNGISTGEFNERIEYESAGVVNDFILRKGVYFTNEIKAALRNVTNLSSYIKKSIDFLKRSDKVEFFKDINDLAMDLPAVDLLLKKERISSLESLTGKDYVTGKNGKNSFFTVNSTDKGFLSDMESENISLMLLLERTGDILNDLGSLAKKGPGTKAVYWRDDHENVYLAMKSLIKLSNASKERLLKTKKEIDDYILKNGKNKNKYFINKFSRVENKIESMLLNCNRLSSHLKFILAQMGRDQNKTKLTLNRIIKLEIAAIKFKKAASKDLFDKIFKELNIAFEEYNGMITKVDLEIADNFFEIRSREK